MILFTCKLLDQSSILQTFQILPREDRYFMLLWMHNKAFALQKKKSIYVEKKSFVTLLRQSTQKQLCQP